MVFCSCYVCWIVCSSSLVFFCPAIPHLFRPAATAACYFLLLLRLLVLIFQRDETFPSSGHSCHPSGPTIVLFHIVLLLCKYYVEVSTTHMPYLVKVISSLSSRLGIEKEITFSSQQQHSSGTVRVIISPSNWN